MQYLSYVSNFGDKNGQVFNVKAYGAKGDGTTDDTAAIQATIDAIPTAGGRVYFPSGKYRVTAQINIDKSYVTLEGANTGFRSIYFEASDPNAGSGIRVEGNIDAFRVRGLTGTRRSGVRFTNLHFRGPGVSSTARAIHTTVDGSTTNATDNLKIDNCTFIYFGTTYAIQLDADDAPDVHSCWIGENGAGLRYGDPTNTTSGINTHGNFYDNGIYDNEGYGLYLSYSSRVIVQGNQFARNANAIRVENSPNVLVSNNSIRQAGYRWNGSTFVSNTNGADGIAVIGTSVEVVDNTIEAARDSGIVFLNTSGAAAGESAIRGNTVTSCVNGIYLYSSGASSLFRGMQIVSNRVSRNTQTGITINYTDDSQVSNNHLFNNGTATASTYDQIFIDNDSNSNSIVGNTIRRGPSGNRARYGIRINNSNCDTNLVATNDILDSGTTGTLSDVGTGTIIIRPGGGASPTLQIEETANSQKGIYIKNASTGGSAEAFVSLNNSAAGTNIFLTTTAKGGVLADSTGFYTTATGGYLFLETFGSIVFAVRQTGQVEIPLTGSTAGLKIGGDTNLYRAAADVLRTDDIFIAATAIGGSTASGGNLTIGSTTHATKGKILMGTSAYDETANKIKIAGSASRGTTEGTNHLDIFNGTAPAGTLTNGISIYSASGVPTVMDASGNANGLGTTSATRHARLGLGAAADGTDQLLLSGGSSQIQLVATTGSIGYIGSTGGYVGWGDNYNFVTGAIPNAGLASAGYFMRVQSNDSYHVWQTNNTNNSAGIERLRLTNVGNLKLGGTANRATTEGTYQVVIFNGTAPVGTLANGVSLYSEVGELRVMDKDGTSTLLSPHDEQNYWVFDSEDTTNGKKLHIDVEKLLRFVNDHFGLDFVKGNMVKGK